jgi:hypothetical protein
MKALSPVAKGSLRDIDILPGLCLHKLLLAKPDVVALATTKKRTRSHTTCLLKLPG